jgi:hypothetical protein
MFFCLIAYLSFREASPFRFWKRKTKSKKAINGQGKIPPTFFSLKNVGEEGYLFFFLFCHT